MSITRRPRRPRPPCVECRRPGRVIEVAGQRLALCADHELDALRALQAAAESLREPPRGDDGIRTVTSARKVRR
jgi:hypothetical protein